ncbi:MAG: hypothetical protein ABIP17_04640 [Ilumatobacteraceae bacterium]
MVLTVVLNLGLRLFPGAGDRAGRRMETWAAPDPDDGSDPYVPQSPQTRVKVFFPWKAMLIFSLVLTILLNVVIRLRWSGAMPVE